METDHRFSGVDGAILMVNRRTDLTPAEKYVYRWLYESVADEHDVNLEGADFWLGMDPSEVLAAARVLEVHGLVRLGRSVLAFGNELDGTLKGTDASVYDHPRHAGSSRVRCLVGEPGP